MNLKNKKSLSTIYNGEIDMVNVHKILIGFRARTVNKISNLNKFFVRLDDENNVSQVLWKYHVNLLLHSFRSVSSDLYQF